MGGKPHHTVEKIGGTSIAATAAVLSNVLIGGRSGAELYGRVFVVSAYAGLTNKLLEDKKTGKPGVHALFASAEAEGAWADALDEVGETMKRLNASVFENAKDCAQADGFVAKRIADIRTCLEDLNRLCSFGHFCLSEHLETVREMLSALGEAHSAHNTALLLRRHGVNATFVDLTGWRDDGTPSLDERISGALETVDLSCELPIVTGYAHCREGMTKSFGRGYTEVTFSRAAVCTGAREAIIHKEFHLSSADPKIVGIDKVRKIGRTNFDVADQLSNMGMEAIHPNAAKGLRKARIPLRVKNTFDHEDEGTVIAGDYISQNPGAEIVTGRKGVLALEFFEQDMVGVKGYDAAILAAMERHKIRIISKSSNANTITHFLHGSLRSAKRVTSELTAQFPQARIAVRKVAIVSAIGSDLKSPGITAIAVGALAQGGVDVLGLHQGLRNVDIQFVIDESDYERSVISLHRALIEGKGAHERAMEAA